MTDTPHDVDVKALLRASALDNIAIACHAKTADFIIKSDLVGQSHVPLPAETCPS